MLISKRRMQASAILFLIVLVAVLFRPVRSWLDQAIVHHAISPNLHVSELTYHSKNSVLEARRIALTSTRGPHVYHLQAARAWVAIEPEPLLDQTLSIPHLLVENVELSLKDYSHSPAQPTTSWRQKLAARVAQLDWDEIKRSFTSLLAAQDVNTTWEKRISRWVMRSTEILRQVDTLDAEADLQNPLRFEDQIKSKLHLVDELKAEQQLLGGQFANLEKLLSAEDKRLRELFQKELQQLRPRNTQNEQQIIREIANDLLLEAAHVLWKQYSPHAEIANAVATEMVPRVDRPSYDRDIGGESEPLCVDDLEAKGDFLLDNKRIPFSLAANYKIARRSDSRSIATGRWDFRFKTTPCTITVLAARAAAFEGLHFVVQIHADSDALPAASPSDRLEDISVLPDSQHFLEFEFNSMDDHIAGQMHVDLERIAGLSEDFASALSQACLEQPGSNLTIDIHGTWQEPTFALPAAVPEFLANSLRSSLDERMRAANTELELQLTSQFNSEVATMERLVNRAAQAGIAIIQDHSQQVAGVRKALQDSLEEMSGTAFARRPQQVKTR